MQVSAELGEPSVNERLRVDFDCLNLSDGSEGDDNSSDHNSIASNSVTLEGPTITQELGAEVPLLRPIRFQTLSSFLVSDDGPVVPAAEQIEATSIDKGITCDRMSWELG